MITRVTCLITVSFFSFFFFYPGCSKKCCCNGFESVEFGRRCLSESYFRFRAAARTIKGEPLFDDDVKDHWGKATQSKWIFQISCDVNKRLTEIAAIIVNVILWFKSRIYFFFTFLKWEVRLLQKSKPKVELINQKKGWPKNSKVIGWSHFLWLFYCCFVLHFSFSNYYIIISILSRFVVYVCLYIKSFD